MPRPRGLIQSEEMPGPADIELFCEDMPDNMKLVMEHANDLESEFERKFCNDLCNWYELHDGFSQKQLPWITRFWQKINEAYGS